MKTISFSIALVLSLFSGCADKEVAIEGIVCPEGYSAFQGAKTFQECRPYDFEAAKIASQPKQKEDCVTKECKEKPKTVIEK